MATTCECPNCNGTGRLPHFSHIANGDCFACGATGTLRLTDFVGADRDVLLEVSTRHGEFWYASLRCRTWKTVSSSYGQCKEWGRDLWCRRIDGVEEARAIWRTAKQNGIETSLCDD
jgi:hypothetical protein